MNSVSSIQLLPLSAFRENGNLVAIEASVHVPFPIGRIFYVYGVPPGGVRGKHAHLRCKQAFVCMAGSCEVTCDDGKETRTFVLSSPDSLLYVPPMIWGTLRYLEPGTVLLALTDLPYDPDDYVHDYDKFLALRKREGR